MKIKKNANNQSNPPHIRSIHLETMPHLENNNIFSENDEYCFELDQSTYSNISKQRNLNNSKQSNNSNTIQMISDLSDLDINNIQNQELKLNYINHVPINKNNKEKKNEIIDINNFKMNFENEKKNLNFNNNIENENSLNNSKNSSYNYEINELNINNNNENTNDIDNEWNIPKITFSEISKVSKAISSERNEGTLENDELSNNNINNINHTNIIKENLKLKKNLKKSQSESYSENNNFNFPFHKKNVESKLSIDDNCRTINLLSSQYSNMDFLKQTNNNFLLMSNYKDIVENSHKFLNKSSSIDFLNNEYSSIKPENEKMKKNLIMQIVLFNNMKNEMENLKKENEDLGKKIDYLNKEQIKFEEKKEEIENENNKRLKEINNLKNKVNKYKNLYKDYEQLKNEYKNLIKKNEQLIQNKDKIINENDKLKEELIELKNIEKEMIKEKSDIDKEKKELINKLNQILEDKGNLNALIKEQNIKIINLEKNINNKNNDISKYQEKIKLLKGKIDLHSNSINKKLKNKLIFINEQNKLNKKNNIISNGFNNDVTSNIKKRKSSNENKNIKQNSENNKNEKNNNKSSNEYFNIDYYKNKLFKKNKIIEKLQAENLNLISMNESKDIQIKELLNNKNEYNGLEEQNKKLKEEINELNLKYTELIEDNNNINNILKNNLLEQIDKLNLDNKQKENEIKISKQKKEDMKKRIIISYGILVDFAKKLIVYANREFQKKSMNLFLKGFKDLIEKLNRQKLNETPDEFQCFESICDFINLMPLEVEILYKRIISLQDDNNNNTNFLPNQNFINTNNMETIKNIEINNINHNSLLTIPQNKKIRKFLSNENNIFFRNEENKIKKLHITEIENSANNSTKKSLKNSKKKNENKIKKKCNSNIYSEINKNSRTDIYKTALNNKINSFNTLQLNNENDTIEGLNLKKFSFYKNGDEKYNDNNNYTICLRKNHNSINLNNNNNNIKKVRKKLRINEKDFNIKILAKKNIINNNKNKESNNENINIKYDENEKKGFISIRNRIINSEFKLQNSIKKKTPQKLLFLNNESNNHNALLYKKEKFLKSDNSLNGNTNFDSNTQNFS